VNIVFASKRELSPNVRAFVDFMKERLGAPKYDGLRGVEVRRDAVALLGADERVMRTLGA
jgi:hypothetical protein